MKCKGHRLGLIIISIKGAAVVIVSFDFFPVDEVREVTHHMVAGIK